MTFRRITLAVACIVCVAFVATLSSLAQERNRPVKRARPPKWTSEDLQTFFDDARTQLVGQRPDYEAARTAANPPTTAEPNDRTATPAGAAWSKLIDAETIETEVKRQSQTLAKLITTPTAFKGGGFEDCRREFSVLALLFAIAAEYDADVRWQDAAPGLRDLFARAGRNCKVGTDQTFKESSERKQDLADLISGGRPSVPSAEKASDWSQVADRPPLMQRLQFAHEERLTKWLVNQREFKKRSDEIRHEAQLVAAIADAIGREGFDYWDDEEYARHVRALRQAATDIGAAVELDNFDQAQKAINRATKSCNDCHELFRG